MIAAIAAMDRSGVLVGTAADQLHQLRGEFGLAVHDALVGVDKVIIISMYGKEASVSTTPRNQIQMALNPIPGLEQVFPVVHMVVDLPRIVRSVRAKLDA